MVISPPHSTNHPSVDEDIAQVINVIILNLMMIKC